MKIESVNPYTAQKIKEYETLSFEDCKNIISSSRASFPSWRKTPMEERTEILSSVANRLRENKKEYGRTITSEMGKPIKEAVAEVEKCALLCDYYAEHSANFLREEIIETEAVKSYVRFDPLGVIFCIMPWNFPFWQVFRFAVPAIAAGNVCVLKHASNVPECALMIEKIFLESGLPDHIFKTLIIDAETALKIIEEDLVDGISLTGSNLAGEKVGSAAGEKIKKIVLELGGSDPFIVLDDANIDRAANMAVKARMFNTGQSCIAAKRFIVMDSVYEKFKEKFIEYMNSLLVGDPMDEKTDVGPLARKEFVHDLEKQVEDAKNKGAEIVSCASLPEGEGFFFQPTVVTGAIEGMAVMDEEVFGPVAPIISVKDEEEAIAVANNTPYGLGAAIWSGNIERAERLAKEINAGSIAINDMVKSDPRLPFGGVKKSGVGRELSHYGIKEFVNIKTVVANE